MEKILAENSHTLAVSSSCQPIGLPVVPVGHWPWFELDGTQNAEWEKGRLRGSTLLCAVHRMLRGRRLRRP
jgi:hypothetical protein